MKNLILLIGIVFLSCFQTTHAQTYDYLKSATATGNGTTTNSSTAWTNVVSVTIDVTNVSSVMLTASINMRPDGSNTNGREANYNIYRSDLTTDESGVIKRQIIRNSETGVESWGIGTLVHIFDVGSLSGNKTYTLEHSNQGASDAGRNVYSTARLTAVALTTATNQYELSCDNKSIPDAGVSTTSSTFEAVAGLTTGTITLPIKGDIFVIASINSEIHTAGSTVAEYRLESSPDGTTWTALGKPVKRTVVNAYDDGIISLVCILQDQNQGTNYKFRVAHRQVSGQTVYTTNTNIVAVALAHSGGGYFPSFCSEVDDTGVDVDWGDSYELVTSSTFTAAADISSTGTSLFVSSQYLVDATNLQTSTTPDERMRAGNQLYVNDGTTTTSAEEYYRYISDNSNFGAGGFIGLMTDLVSEGSYTIGMNHIVKYVSNHTDPKTEILTTSNVILTGFQTYDQPYFLWNGTNTDWSDTDNWPKGAIPTSTSNVYINADLSNYPVVDETANCNIINLFGSLTLNTNADLNISSSVYVSEGGTVTVNAGTLDVPQFNLTYNENITTSKLKITGGTVTIYDSGHQDFLSLDNSGSVLEVTGGILNCYGYLYNAYDDAPAIGTITFSGGTIDFDDGADIDETTIFSISGSADVTFGVNTDFNSNDVEIGVGARLTTENNLSNFAGTLLSTSSGTGSLIVEGTATGDVTVERFVASAAWHLVSPSTTGVTSNNFSIDGTDAWLTEFSESTGTNGEWSYITSLTQALGVGSGYSYWIDGASPNTVEFTGSLRTTDLVQTLAYTNDAHGWNSFGNPFASSLDFDLGTWDPDTKTSGSVYVWDNNKNTTGDYRISGTDLTDGIIPIGQGFFVDATASGNFTIPADARVHSAQGFWKSKEEDESPYVRIQLDGDNIGNTLFIGFPDFGTDERDYAGDARKLYSSETTPQLFAIENNLELCVNTKAPLTEEHSTKTIPLHLVQVIDGSYTLSISQLDQLPDTKITLEDLKTGTIHNFNENTVYNFNASANDSPQRFLLHFGWSPDGIDEDAENASNINIYSYGNEIYIRSSEEAINQKANVFVYDMLGREILSTQIQGNELEKIRVNVENAYVVVKVVKDGFVKTEKVFVK